MMESCWRGFLLEIVYWKLFAGGCLLQVGQRDSSNGSTSLSVRTVTLPDQQVDEVQMKQGRGFWMTWQIGPEERQQYLKED